MASLRKLQAEVDRVLKQILEHIADFDALWDKCYSAPTPAQKEKYEGDLKKEIKKLQRLRDQVKVWVSNNDIKNKKPLLDARKAIETEMERFKVLEKEVKTKAYSKEGLNASLRKNEQHDQAKEACITWLEEIENSLTSSRDELEQSIESLKANSTKKKKGQTGGDKQDELQARLDKHNWHLKQIETIKERLEEDSIAVEAVDGIKDDLQYYVDSHAEADFQDDETIYEALDLDNPDTRRRADSDGEGEVEEAENEEEAEEEREEEKDEEEEEEEEEEEPKTKSDKNKAAKAQPTKNSQPAAAAAKPAAAATAAATPAAAAAKPPASAAAAAAAVTKPASAAAAVAAANPAAARPATAAAAAAATQPAAAAAAKPLTAAAAAVGAKAPAPVAPQPAKPAESLAAIVSKSKEAEQRKTTAAAAVKAAPATAPTSAAAAAALGASKRDSQDEGEKGKSPPGLNRPGSIPAGAPGTTNASPPLSATPPPIQQQIAPAPSPGPIQSQSQNQITLGNTFGGVAGANLGQPQSPSALQLPIGALEQPHYKDRDRGMLADDYAYNLSLLEPSLKNLPDPADTDRPKQYVPRNPYRTPVYFPSVPAPIFDDPALFEKLSVDTLFFIFYFQQGTPHQYLAARELKKQSWRYHKNFLTWFQRHDDPKLTTEEFEQGTYVYFDYESGWCQRIKSDFTFEYKHLEDELSVPLAGAI